MRRRKAGGTMEDWLFSDRSLEGTAYSHIRNLGNKPSQHLLLDSKFCGSPKSTVSCYSISCTSLSRKCFCASRMMTCRPVPAPEAHRVSWSVIGYFQGLSLSLFLWTLKPLGNRAQWKSPPSQTEDVHSPE